MTCGVQSMIGSSKKSTKRSPKKSAKKSAKRSMKKWGGYSEKVTKLILKSKNAKSKKAAKITGTEKLKCPAGKIKRNAFMRKSKSGKIEAVGAKCVTNTGKPGKAKRTILLAKKGLLERYGYNNIKNLNKNQREDSLRKAVQAYGYVEVIRRLNAIANLLTRTSPEVSNKIRMDQKMVSNWYDEAKKNGLLPTPK